MKIDFFKKIPVSFLVVSPIFFVFLGFSYFISDPIKAGKIDRYILYNIDDIFRYCFIKASLQNPLIFLHPHIKPLSVIISSFFCRLLPWGMISVRIMNSLFSTASLFVFYNLMGKLKVEKPLRVLGIFIIVTVPLYFLISISTLSEMMFCFFLIFSIFLFYSGRYLFSTITISLLPIVRQEGLLFLAIWFIFLLIKNRIKYAFLLFIPAFSWAVLNYFILGHLPFFTFMYVTSISKDIPVQLLPAAIKFLFTLGYPALFLFLLGLIISLRKRENFLILVCFLVPFVAQIILNQVGFICFPGKPSAKMRFMVPYVPLITIFVLVAIKTVIQNLKVKKSIKFYFLSVMAITLLAFQIHQIKQLQEEPEAKGEFFSSQQEVALQEASRWLDDYAKKENIANIYIPGDESTYKSLRRLWMYLSPGLKYYIVSPPHYTNLFDVTILKPLSFRKKGILVSFQEHTFDSNLGYKFIKGMPFIPLYFYLASEQRDASH